MAPSESDEFFGQIYMNQEINLLEKYPRSVRDVKQREDDKTEEDRRVARKFGKEFFDGDRRTGYGGFHYHPRFWGPVVPDFQAQYDLRSGDSLFDVGCAKGFMLYDFMRSIPGLIVAGLDISEYAIEHAIEEVRPFCRLGDARELPFKNNSYDVVVSVNTIHNLDRADLIVALKEIERVASRGAFITVDAYRTDEEKEAMFAWNLTAKTILHVDDWKDLFAEAGFNGDYYWFMP